MKITSLMTKLSLFCCAFAAISGVGFAQVTVTIADLGSAPPTPGPLDIYCTNTGGSTFWSGGTGGLNYYTDNGTPPGSIFTNGPAVIVTSVAVRFAGLDRGTYPGSSTPSPLGPQTWRLRIYSLNGTTATMLGYYQSQTFTVTADGDWVQFTGLNIPLSANSTNGYSFGRGTAANANWCAMAVCSNNPSFYGGETCQVALWPGSTVVGQTGSIVKDTFSPLFDGNFVIGCITPNCPVTSMPTISPTNEVYGGSPVTLTEVAAGSATLTYQWQCDGGTGNSTTPGSFTNILGATSTVLSNTIPPYNGVQTFVWYQCIVHNNCGNYTSAATNVIVDAPHIPIDISGACDPNPNLNYAYVNGNINFAATFTGTLPITYQWQTDAGQTGSYTNIPGQTNATMYLNGVQLSSAGNYRVQASNAVGGPVNSGAGVLNVAADPAAPISSQYFAYKVYTNSPIAYWRLSEQTTLFNCYSEQAYDYSGNTNFATYGSGAYIPAAGPQSPAFPGFEADNSCVQLINGGTPANSFLYAPAVNLNTNTATFIAWINPGNQPVPASCGLFMNRDSSDAAGFCFGTVQSNSIAELGYTWNSNSPATYNYNSSLFPPSNQWSFVALTITPTNANLYMMYKDINTSAVKIFKAVNNVTNSPEAFTNGTSWIGSDNYTDGRDFPGFLDEVAVFNKSLSDLDLQNLFLTAVGGSAPCPSIGQQPGSQTILGGQLVQWTSVASGGLPLSYQWQGGTTGSGIFTNLLDGGLGQITGSQSPTLTISNALAGDFRLAVTNNNSSCGTVYSSVATVTIIPIPAGLWTANFAVTNQSSGVIGLYNGRGILGTGTYWNALPCTNNTFDHNITVSNLTSLNDAASSLYPGSNIVITIFSPGGPYFLTPDITLFGAYLIGQADNATGPAYIDCTNVPNGKYNVALYACDGARHDQSTDFVINGVTNSTVNVQDLKFALGDNCVLFENVVVTNNDLLVTNGVNTGVFNGLQIQAALLPSVTLNIQKSGANVILTWTAGTLLEATNVKGPYTATAGSPTSPYTVPASATQKFYRLSIP